ncbi:MAG: hypothetical protein WC471_06080 [Candidatus Woesearchaeota archaeon]|jgi:hypothetical protein
MGFESNTGLGVLAHYGVRTVDSKFGAEIDDDVIKTIQWTFSYNDLPTGATHNLGASIPANATILSAKLQIIDAFTSTSTTTDLLVGLEQADGTDIDLDGLITAAQATQTTIAVVNSVIDGASGTPGALIGTTIGTAAGELIVTSSAADLLTGKARLIVQYIKRGL